MRTSYLTRYEYMDALRGIAALTVVLAHALEGSQLTKLWGGALSWVSYGHFGETGVVTFFFVSGFVIPLSMEKSSDLSYFWLNRALRIYPLYIFVYFVTIASVGFDNVPNIAAFLVNFSAHIMFIQEYVKQPQFVGGAWTLALEVIWYIGFAILFALNLHRNMPLLIGVTVLGCVLALLVSLTFVPLPLGRISMLVVCVLGLVHYRYMKLQITRRDFWVYSALLLIAVAANICFRSFMKADEARSMIGDLMPWVFAYGLFFTGFFTRQSSFWTNEILNHIGRISYSAYLVHSVVIIYLVKISGFDGLWFIIATFVITLLISTLTYKYIETPPVRFGHSLRPKRPTSIPEPNP